MAQARRLDNLAFVFPGQGSQAVGMLDEYLSNTEPDFEPLRQCFAQASAALGYDLAKLVQTGPEEQLNQTAVTQPAILTASVGLWRTWLGMGGPTPAYFAGHSLGEYSALVCAGSLSLSDAVGLVRDRGELMQQAVPLGEGAMAAILGLADDEVDACCAAIDGEVASANYNTPGQVVIAGTAAAVAAAIDACKAAGAKKAMPVAMSVPSHSSLLEQAAVQLGERLAALDIQPPDGVVVHNVDAQPAATAAEIRAKLVAQLHNPVRWSACSTYLGDAGVQLMIECGPGKVLSGMQKRIDKSRGTHTLGSVAGLQGALAALAE